MFRPPLWQHKCNVMRCRWTSEHSCCCGIWIRENELWHQANRSAYLVTEMCGRDFLRGGHPNGRLSCSSRNSSGWSSRAAFCVQEDTVCGTTNTSQVRTFEIARAAFNCLFVLRHSCSSACHVTNRTVTTTALLSKRQFWSVRKFLVTNNINVS
jgi:hypothetical protein